MYMSEVTIGAALPIRTTLNDLLCSGDAIHAIVGLMSVSVGVRHMDAPLLVISYHNTPSLIISYHIITRLLLSHHTIPHPPSYLRWY